MTVPSSVFTPGPATRVRRKDRADADPAFIIQVIDEALITHVAFCTNEGLPQCFPMAFARVGDVIYLHGAMASLVLNNLQATRCSLTFTLLDGLVFARSAYQHSMNYRCVVVVGRARLVEDTTEKRRALTAVVDHAAKGRSEECIGMTDAEVRSTCVIAVDVEEAVAKRRQGPPVDDDTHKKQGQVFAGVVPVALHAQAVERDIPRCSLPISPAIERLVRKLGAVAVYEKHEGEVLFSSDPSRMDVEWVHTALSTRAYWAQGITRETLIASWRNSLVFGVYTDGRQVGCARVLADGARLAYLGDVFVDEAYRGRGLGKALVTFVLAHPVVASCERVLLGTKDAQALYRQFGFAEPSNTPMVKQRSPNDALASSGGQ